MAGRDQARRQQQTHQGSGRRHDQGPPGGGRFPLDAGHTPQQEQGDAAHLDPLGDGGKGMAQLMEQDGHKQQQGRGQGQQPDEGFGSGHTCPQQRLLAVLLAEAHGGQGQDQKPAGMDAQGNAPDPQELKAFTHTGYPVALILERLPFEPASPPWWSHARARRPSGR